MQGKKAKHLAYSLEIMGIFIYTGSGKVSNP
jgi:hypothetical protein